MGQEVNRKVPVRQSEPTRRHSAVLFSVWRSPNPSIERTPSGKLRLAAVAARVKR